MLRRVAVAIAVVWSLATPAAAQQCRSADHAFGWAQGEGLEVAEIHPVDADHTLMVLRSSDGSWAVLIMGATGQVCLLVLHASGTRS